MLDGCIGVLWVEWGWSFLLGQNVKLLHMGFAIVEYVWQKIFKSIYEVKYGKYSVI
jgi:hypothetical protein